MKPILTTPETVEIYLENFNQLGSAIMNSGGEPFRILKKYDDFLRTLAANNISITAKYDGPEFKKQEDHTKEEYNAVSYEQHEADAIDEECRMTEEDYDEIDWNKWMEENSEEKTKPNKNDSFIRTVMRVSDGNVFTINDNQKFYRHIAEGNKLEHYTFEEVQKFINQGLFSVLEY